MTDILPGASLPYGANSPLGGVTDPTVAPTTTPTTTTIPGGTAPNANGSDTSQNVSAAATAAPTLKPAEVVGAAATATNPIDAAVNAQTIASFKANSTFATILKSKSPDFQNSVWNALPDNIRSQLAGAGYSPPDSTTAPSQGWWHDALHIVDDGKSVADKIMGAGKSLIGGVGKVISAAAAPLNQAARAFDLNAQNTVMQDSQNTGFVSRAEGLLNIINPASIARDWHEVQNGASSFQPAALDYVQTQLGVTGSAFQILKAYVSAGGQGQSAMQAALASVPQAQANAAMALIVNSPKFQEAANLLNDSHLSPGQMLFGGLNAQQLHAVMPGTSIGAFQGAQAALGISGVAGAAATTASGGGEGLIAKGADMLAGGEKALGAAKDASTFLDSVGSLRGAASAGVAGLGTLGVARAAMAGKTGDQANQMSPFGIKVNPMSGLVDGTVSWYANPLFLGQRAMSAYKGAVHGMGALDAMSNTKALQYYTTRGAGIRFVNKVADLITQPEAGSQSLSYELSKVPNLAALDSAGIKTQGMDAIVKEWYPKIVEAQKDGRGGEVVADMMSSNQALINVLRGNAGQYFHDVTLFPRVTVPRAILDSFKGMLPDSAGKRINVGPLTPRAISTELFGQELTDRAVQAQKEGQLGKAALWTRRALTLSPSRIVDMSSDKSWVDLQRVLGYSLTDAYIEHATNYYRNLDTADLFKRRQSFLGGIKDMMIAAGVDQTDKGSEWMKTWLEREGYSFEDNAKFVDPRDPQGMPRENAILDNQASSNILLPDFRQLLHFSKQAYVMDKLEMGINADFFDKFMSRFWKPAMLLRPGFGIRVAAEEITNFILRHSLASYVNTRIATSLYDSANTSREAGAVAAFKAEQKMNGELTDLATKATLGDAHAADLHDAYVLTNSMLDFLPPEVVANIKTPEEFMASIHGFRAINVARKLGLKMVPDHILEGAMNLAKHGVLGSTFSDYIDAVTSHGSKYLGDVPTTRTINMLTPEGATISLKRTGEMGKFGPDDGATFLPKLRVLLHGITTSEVGKIAAKGLNDGGHDVAVQNIIDWINGERLNRQLEIAKEELANVKPGDSQEFRDAMQAHVDSRTKAIADRKNWLKRFAGSSQTRDGRTPALGTATPEQVTRDWAEAITAHVEHYSFSDHPQDFEIDKTTGERTVPVPTNGSQPIRLQNSSPNREPYQIRRGDEGRKITPVGERGGPISVKDEELAYSGIPKDHIRLFRGENNKTLTKGGDSLDSPGRTWFPSYNQALAQAGEDGQVYKITVPRDVLEQHYEYKSGTNIPDSLVKESDLHDISTAQSANAHPDTKASFVSGDISRGGDKGSQRTVVAELARGVVPSEEDLRTVDPIHWPAQMSLPETVLKVDGPQDFVSKIMEKGMTNVVAKPINWMSRQPIYTYNYALGLRDARALIKGLGIEDKDGVLAHDIAMDRAANETLPFIHNPSMKSYMSIAMRNVAPFWFAQEQFYKRWGKLFGAYPEAFYKLSQTMTGLKTVGFLYTDQYGQAAFSYPGSQAALNLLGSFFNVTPGVGFSTEVSSLNPSLSAGSLLPIPSAGPLIALPTTILGGLFPSLTGFGNAIRGGQTSPISSSEWPVQAIQEIAPSILNRLFTWGSSLENGRTDPGMQALLMSSSIMAIQQLEASGHGLTTAQQANSTAINQYLDRVINYSKTITLTRALFGFIAPGTPNFQIATTGPGMVYRALLNEMPYDQAMTELIKLYPNATPETVFASTTGGTIPYEGSGTYVPATAGAAKYINDNKSFVESYPQLAPWSFPVSTQKGLFNGTAYNEEKSLALRNPRSLQDWYNEVKYAEGANTYYPVHDTFLAAESSTAATSIAAQTTLGITQAQAQAQLGVTNQSEQAIKSAWATWEAGFMKANPIFSLTHTETGDVATARRANIISQLNDAINSGHLPQGQWGEKVSQLMTAYNQVYDAYYPTTGAGVRGTQATENKQAMLTWGTAFAKDNPIVAQIWNGVISKAVPG